MNPGIIILIFVVVVFGACSVSRHTVRDKSGNSYGVIRTPDRKDWITKNLSVEVPGSSCYDNLKENCDRYGRLYDWKIANTVCNQLGEGWRLPSSDEWKSLAKNYGGAFGDSNDDGKAAFIALMDGGISEFDAMLSGGGAGGEFWRIDAHGFYWMSTEVTDSTAWFANFGKGRPALYLQSDGGKTAAFAVRCVKDSK
jgi:uncharacterized protein (TIGR02145 family)